MVNAHGVVGRDGPVQERPFWLAAVFLPQLLESVDLLPVFQDGPFLGREIDLRIHLVERHDKTSPNDAKALIL